MNHVFFFLAEAGPHLPSIEGWKAKCVSDVVVSALDSINEVNQRWARLVLRWVTVQFPVRDIYLGMWPATQVNSAWPPLRG